MKRIALIALTLICVCSCKNTKPLLPNVSGKAGEVIVVMDRESWDDALGEDVRGLLACDCPWLPVTEPLYSLVNVTPGGFADLFKVHRNIVYFDIASGKKAQTILRKDVWAEPQCVIQISAPTAAIADSLVRADGAKIAGGIEQAERDRVIHNSILYENKNVAPVVREIFGGSPHFPTGYKIRKTTNDFVWIADDKQYTMQDVLIYKYPASSEDVFSLDAIIAKRNEVLKNNVPGMYEGTYMTTSETSIDPTIEFLRYKGRAFAQVRGWWDVEGDFMGGPFVSHTFYSQDGKDIIVAEAFVYAPKFDKRQYLRQVESILYSWEWAKTED